MRKDFGGIFPMVLILTVALATVISVILPMSTHASERQSRLQEEFLMDEMFESILDKVEIDIVKTGSLVALPYTASTTGLGGNISVTVSDNSGSLPKSVLVTADISRFDVTKTYSRVVPINLISPLTAYALACSSTINQSKTLTITGADAAIYSTGAYTISQNLISTGDLELASTISDFSKVSVGGLIRSGVSVLTMPNITATDYSAIATNMALSSVGNISFSGGPPYPCYYFASNLTLTGGTVTGIGTVYVDGDVTISGNYSYSAEAKMVIIAKKISISSSTTAIVGMLFCDNSLSLSGTSALTMDGAIWTRAAIALNRPITLAYDNTAWANPSMAKDLRIPGYWP